MLFQVRPSFDGIPLKLMLVRLLHLGIIPRKTQPAKRLCRNLPTEYAGQLLLVLAPPITAAILSGFLALVKVFRTSSGRQVLVSITRLGMRPAEQRVEEARLKLREAEVAAEQVKLALKAIGLENRKADGRFG